MQETYTIFRNLGYLARGANVISDALDNLGGKPLSDEQKRARARQQRGGRGSHSAGPATAFLPGAH